MLWKAAAGRICCNCRRVISLSSANSSGQFGVAGMINHLGGEPACDDLHISNHFDLMGTLSRLSVPVTLVA
jgi:hypothetical protein